MNISRYLTRIIFMMAVIISLLVGGCGSDEGGTEGTVTGTLKDGNGNVYPNTPIKLTKGSDELETKTNVEGEFTFTALELGAYELTFTPPLSTIAVTNVPVAVNVEGGKTATVNLVLHIPGLIPVVVAGSADIFLEIKVADGNLPVNDGDLLYAMNISEPPIGLLVPIHAPDDHHVTFSEWKDATGGVITSCDGNKSSVAISLTGMIPNGTYSFWFSFLNKPKSVGQAVNFSTDLVLNVPVGSGSENVAIASEDGSITGIIQHPSCALTQSPGLVMAVVYHINGNTYGADHIPDTEEVTHMLLYFQ